MLLASSWLGGVDENTFSCYVNTVLSLLLICFHVLFLVSLWVFRIIIFRLVNVVNNCFRISPSHVILSKLLVFLQLEYLLKDQMCEHSATEANGRMKNITCVTCDTYLILHWNFLRLYTCIYWSVLNFSCSSLWHKLSIFSVAPTTQ